MGFLKQIGLPIAALAVFIVLVIIGFTSGQTGWVALSLLCAWPFTWAVSAWVFRGLRENYQLVPKPQTNGAQQQRRPRPIEQQLT